MSRILPVVVVLAVLVVTGYAAESKSPSVLGIQFDHCRIFELKGKHRHSSYSLFKKSGKLNKRLFSDARIVPVDEEDAIVKVLDGHKSYSHDSCDCMLVPFALVFYRNGAPVLQIFPNATGGDIWSKPRTAICGKNPGDAGWGQLLRACYASILHGKRLPNKTDAGDGK